MNNAEAVTDFTRRFIQAPELCGAALQEALKLHGYEVTFKKIPKPAKDEPEDYIYQFPFMTGERSVAVL